MRERFWELAGSKLGELLKVSKAPEQEAEDGPAPTGEEEFDYRAES